MNTYCALIPKILVFMVLGYAIPSFAMQTDGGAAAASVATSPSDSKVDQKKAAESSYKKKLEDFNLNDQEKKELELRAKAFSNINLLEKALHSVNPDELPNRKLLLNVVSNMLSEALLKFLTFFNERDIGPSILFTTKRRKHAMPILQKKIGQHAFSVLQNYIIGDSELPQLKEALDTYLYDRHEAPEEVVALIDAICAEDSAMVTERLNDSAIYHINYYDQYFYPPLFYAVILNLPDIAELLLRNGAAANIKLTEDGTIPMLLVMDPQCELNKILVRYGSDINAVDQRGETPLLTAIIQSIKASERSVNVAQAILARNDIQLGALVKGIPILEHLNIVLKELASIEREIRPDDTVAKNKNDQIKKIYEDLVGAVHNAQARLEKRAQIQQKLAVMKKAQEKEQEQAKEIVKIVTQAHAHATAAHAEPAPAAGAGAMKKTSVDAKKPALTLEQAAFEGAPQKKWLAKLFKPTDDFKSLVDMASKRLSDGRTKHKAVLQNKANNPLLAFALHNVLDSEMVRFLAIFTEIGIQAVDLLLPENLELLAKKGFCKEARALFTLLKTKASVASLYQKLLGSLVEDDELSQLIAAIVSGNATILEEILKTNATKINDLDYFGFAPLHYALILNELGCVAVLLRYNADAHLAARNGMLPLFLAHDNQAVQLLQGASHDNNAQIKAQKKALMNALQNPCEVTPKIVARLIELGVKVKQMHIVFVQDKIQKAAHEADKIPLRMVLAMLQEKNVKDCADRARARGLVLVPLDPESVQLELPSQPQPQAQPVADPTEQLLAQRIELLTREKQEAEALKSLNTAMAQEHAESQSKAAKKKAAKKIANEKNRERLRKEREEERRREQLEIERAAQERATREAAAQAALAQKQNTVTDGANANTALIVQSTVIQKPQSRRQLKAAAIAQQIAHNKLQKEQAACAVTTPQSISYKKPKPSKDMSAQAPAITNADAKRLADKRAQEETQALEAQLKAARLAAQELERKKLEDARIERENEIKAQEADKVRQLQEQRMLSKYDVNAKKQAQAKSEAAAEKEAKPASPVDMRAEPDITQAIKPEPIHVMSAAPAAQGFAAKPDAISFTQPEHNRSAFSAPLPAIKEDEEHRKTVQERALTPQEILARDQALIRAKVHALRKAKEDKEKADKKLQVKNQVIFPTTQEINSLRTIISVYGMPKDVYAQHVQDFNIKQRELRALQLQDWIAVGGTPENQFNNPPLDILNKYQALAKEPLRFENRYGFFEKLDVLKATDKDYAAWLKVHWSNVPHIGCNTCARFDAATRHHVDTLCSKN